MTSKKQESKTIWILIGVLALIGLLLSIHAEYVHHQLYMNPQFKSGCAANANFNCETVALSSYAVIFKVPVAVWGILLYAMFLLIIWRGMRQNPDEMEATQGYFLVLSTIAVVGSAILGYISHTKIGTLCPSCMGTYLVNGLFFVFAFLMKAKQKRSLSSLLSSLSADLKKSIFFYTWPVLVAIALPFIFPKYWSFQAYQKDVPHGVSANGDHWIGAKKPTVTIVEYADYECPYCALGHALLRFKYVNKYKDKVRLVHKHFPLGYQCNDGTRSKKFHIKACMFSKAVYCAGKQGKFWLANDFVYRHKKRLTKSVFLSWSKKLKLNRTKLETCMGEPSTHEAIKKDIASGRKVGVRGTPAYFINGKKVGLRVLEKTVQALLSGKKDKTSPTNRPSPKTRKQKITPKPSKRSQ